MAYNFSKLTPCAREEIVRLILILAIAIAIVTSPAQAEKTTHASATRCITEIVEERRQGGSLAYLVEKYVHVESLAKRAIQVQKRGPWKSLTPTAQETARNDVLRYFAQEKERVKKQKSNLDDVNPDTVKVDPSFSKSVGDSIEVRGTYETLRPEKVNFGARVQVVDGRCWIIDARWKDAWLSAFLPLTN